MKKIKHIENVLEQYTELIGADMNKYRNHVYRVYHYTLLSDNIIEEDYDKIAIAAVFHDIAIWTHSTFDYLDPSISLTMKYLEVNDLEFWKEELTLIIDMHHKISKYKGKYNNTVEAFRRADWIDLSFGLLHFNIPKIERKRINLLFPSFGFHRFLVFQSIKNLIKHPFNPLPMFKK